MTTINKTCLQWFKRDNGSWNESSYIYLLHIAEPRICAQMGVALSVQREGGLGQLVWIGLDSLSLPCAGHRGTLETLLI